MTTIALTPVTRANLKTFIRLPHAIQDGNRNWIAPLDWERQRHLSTGNPYFRHARWQGWIAWRGDQPVGRISAQIDDLYRRQHGCETGFFGMLEAIDSRDVFKALLTQAETWLRQAGMTAIQGPFNLSINQECGLLVEGFEHPPVVMMPYNPPYYATHLQALGYVKEKDLLAYELDTSSPTPATIRMLQKSADALRVRPLARAHILREFESLRTLFNDAWAENWGFVPFTREEFSDIANTLKHIIEDDFVQIAEWEGEAVGMIVAVPDLNQLLSGLDGRLLPFNWLKLLWRWRRHYPDTGRVILMGVRRRYRQTLVGAAIAYALVEALRHPITRKGIRRLELSWILEDNRRMRAIIESLGARCYKRYRIYGKPLP